MRWAEVDFGRITARIATTLGLPPSTVREMGWDDVSALGAYWSEYPPQHETLALQAGTARPRSTEKFRPSSKAEVEAFTRRMMMGRM